MTVPSGRDLGSDWCVPSLPSYILFVVCYLHLLLLGWLDIWFLTHRLQFTFTHIATVPAVAYIAWFTPFCHTYSCIATVVYLYTHTRLVTVTHVLFYGVATRLRLLRIHTHTLRLVRTHTHLFILVPRVHTAFTHTVVVVGVLGLP